MKIRAPNLFLIVVVLLSFSFSPKRQIDPTTAPGTLQGIWIGTYTASHLPEQGPLFWSFIIYADNTIIVRSTGGDGNYYYCSGKCSLSADGRFYASIRSFVTPGIYPVTQELNARLSAKGELINGTWKDVENKNGFRTNGNFSAMIRVEQKTEDEPGSPENL